MIINYLYLSLLIICDFQLLITHILLISDTFMRFCGRKRGKNSKNLKAKKMKKRKSFELMGIGC